MTPLSPSLVRLDASPKGKREAIAEAGRMLVEDGAVDAGFVRSLLAREDLASTYLGAGIAFPHGLAQDRALVRRTAVAVLQIPAGIPWDGGEVVRLLVAMAARSDEHVELLARLTRLLDDHEALRRLATTPDADEIVVALVGGAPRAGPVHAAEDLGEGFALALDYPAGLHARPAARWVEAANAFEAELQVRVGAAAASAKSLVALLQLCVKSGQVLHVSARGPDARAALEALRRAIVALVPEERAQAAVARAAPAPAAVWRPRASPAVIPGLAASPGLAVGTLRRHVSRRLEPEDEPAGTEEDRRRLEAALAAVEDELERLAIDTHERVGAAEAAIFRAHRELLRDPELTSAVAARLAEGHGAAWAWRRTLDAQVDTLHRVDNPILAARAADLADAGERVLRQLLGVAYDGIEVDPGTILAAEDLRPSDTATLDPARVVGLCTARGGPTSHTAILARTLGVPALVAGGDALLLVPDGTLAILDGDAGRLYAAPAATDVESARAWQSQEVERRARDAARRLEPAVTLDGHRIEVSANVNRPEQAAAAIQVGADGVGLMRTEFLFLERPRAPDEEEQYAIYAAMVAALGGRPLIVRTLDIGGDKQVPFLGLPHEENPFLGVRGARLCLRRPALFEPQLRALYRAARRGPLWIMFPMVSTLEEVEQLRAFAERVRDALGAPPVPLGVMIEVPSAALLAEALAARVDFFSLGTNDLTQYTLAVDREHPELAAMADSLHPAVLQLVERTVAGARAHDRWVGVCGELAADPLGAVLLAGLGVDELSMSARDVAGVKARLRATRIEDARALAARAVACRSAAEVRALEGAP